MDVGRSEYRNPNPKIMAVNSKSSSFGDPKSAEGQKGDLPKTVPIIVVNTRSNAKAKKVRSDVCTDRVFLSSLGGKLDMDLGMNTLM